MRIPNNAEIFQYFWLFWGKTKMFTFPKFRRPPTTRIYCCPVLSWWAEDYTDKWPNMARRNSESGPRAELWRFRLFGIESRLEPEGKVRISNEPPGVVKNYSHQWCQKRKYPFSRNRSRHSLWKNKLGFLLHVLWKPPAEIQLHPVSGLHNLERVLPPLFTYISTHPTCYTTYSTRTSGIYIKSHQMYSSPVHTQPGLKREIGPPTGL